MTPEKPPAERRTRSLVAIALVALAVYANTLTNELVYDDQVLIPHQPALHDPFDLRAILGSTYWSRDDNLYRPLTLWTLALNHRANRLLGLPGEHPTGYHAANLVLHLAVCSALYLLLTALGTAEWAALAAALGFAVHPLHSEAVAPAVGRSELLAGLCGLSFLLLHRRRRRVVLAMLCLVLALGAKESAVAFLPLALLMDLCFGERPPWSRYLVYTGTLGGWLALRAAIVPAGPMRIPPLDNPLVQATLAERWLTAARVQLDYLRLQLWPVGLSSDYSFDQIPLVTSVLDARVLGFLAVTLAAGAVAFHVRRRQPIVPFAVLGYALLFLPASNFVVPIGTIMGERLAYAPSLLSSALAALALFGLRQRLGRAVTAAVGVVLAVLAGLTVARNRTWADEERHVRALVHSAPRSAKAHYLLARLECDAHRFAQAETAARVALAIHPAYAEAWNELGVALAGRGDLAEAVEAHERAVRIHPAYAEAWDHLGQARTAQGDLEGAVAAFRAAVRLEPALASHHFGLGLALQRARRLDEAAVAYLEAIRLAPGAVAALTNLGSLRAEQGRTAEARELWQRALAIDPHHAPARDNLERLRRLGSPP